MCRTFSLRNRWTTTGSSSDWFGVTIRSTWPGFGDVGRKLSRRSKNKKQKQNFYYYQLDDFVLFFFTAGFQKHNRLHFQLLILMPYYFWKGVSCFGLDNEKVYTSECTFFSVTDNLDKNFSVADSVFFCNLFFSVLVKWKLQNILCCFSQFALKELFLRVNFWWFLYNYEKSIRNMDR